MAAALWFSDSKDQDGPASKPGQGVDDDDHSSFDEAGWESDEDAPKSKSNRTAQTTLSSTMVTPQSSGRAAVGKAPVRKSITTELDSDDERLIDLKHKGLSNNAVRDIMIKENRMRYDEKTIGNRWHRISTMLGKTQDEDLDDELSDWHEGEDNHLYQIKDAIDKEIEMDIAKLRSKRWQQVSEIYANRIHHGKKKYTAKACEERFNALEEGTALLPIELDPDQDGRLSLRATRIAAARRVREQDRQADKRAEQARVVKRRSQKQIKLDEEEGRLKMLADKRIEREAALRVKHEKRQNATKLRELKSRRSNYEKCLREWLALKAKTEDDLYEQLTGRKMPKLAKDDKTTPASEVIAIEKLVDFNVQNNNHNVANPSEGLPNNVVNLEFFSESQNGIENFVKLTHPVKVCEHSLRSPRSIMTSLELYTVFASHNLPQPLGNENHMQLVATLIAADHSLTTDHLDKLLVQAGEDTQGTQQEKIDRLQESDAKRSHRGLQGYTSTDLEFMRTYEGYQGEFYHLLEAAKQTKGLEGEPDNRLELCDVDNFMDNFNGNESFNLEFVNDSTD